MKIALLVTKIKHYCSIVLQVTAERDNLPGDHRPPLLVKIAADMTKTKYLFTLQVKIRGFSLGNVFVLQVTKQRNNLPGDHRPPLMLKIVLHIAKIKCYVITVLLYR